MSANGPLQCDPRFRQLDLISSPIFVLEPNAHGVPCYVAFNAFAREIARRPLTDYIGRAADEVYGGAMGQTALQRHREVLSSSKAITYEIDLPIGDKKRTVRTTLIPERDPDGDVCLLYGTSTDMTDVQKSREAQVSFDTVATEMEQFVAMAAHDLRAPMRNVGQIAHMLREDFIDYGDGKMDLIDMLEEISAKSMELIADVLRHAHAVDISQSHVRFNFGSLCRDLCDVIDPHQNHVFTYTSAEVVSDRTAIQIGLRNLIENAVKYGGRQRLRIDISLHRGQNGMLDVMISDNGDGFPGAAIEFLNGGGFRVDSGYGLLGVRRMVQARGGSMTAGNVADGSGAVIRFSLRGEWIGLTNSLGDPLSGLNSNTNFGEPPAA